MLVQSGAGPPTPAPVLKGSIVTLRRYLMMNLAIAGLSGVFVGPVLWLKDRIRRLRSHE